MTPPLRRVVGVTGHRDHALADADQELLRRRVDGVLEVLAQRGAEELISGLAEGADRLVARRALRAGWSLRALLPFPPDRYEEDFADAGSRADFRRLLSRSASVEIAPGTPGRTDREGPYAVQGRILVSRLHVLVAVWDGRPARGAGGTGDVVEHALEAGRPVVWIHARPPHRVRFADMRDVHGPFRGPLADGLGPLLDAHQASGAS